MRLTALGVNGPFPGPGGACSGYLIESDSGNTRVLLECGAGILGRCKKFIQIEELDAILISHLHFDHMSDLLPMQYAMQFSPRETAIPVYVPDGPGDVRDMIDKDCYDLFPHEDTTVGEMDICFVPAVHPVVGSCISISCDGVRLVFTGDTNETPVLELFAQGADMLLMDAGLMEKDWHDRAPHLSALRCGRIAREAGAKALLLTHFNPRYEIEDVLEEAKTHYPNAEAAKPGKVYTV